ncbi:hypothetical protein [Stieleria magnilauensis]|uniref:Uncharacterized protein n=1 Tax=Stieleria magnilauensis TaxID=2527963 RepID=A0ABX5Y0A2_9BACT|nr:hypothetical protein TBK1r_64170 [Planctomycetes bacterium TBK1r]
MAIGGQWKSAMKGHVDGLGSITMSISLETVSVKYLAAKKLSAGSRKEYRSTVSKWTTWGNGVDNCRWQK